MTRLTLALIIIIAGQSATNISRFIERWNCERFNGAPCEWVLQPAERYVP